MYLTLEVVSPHAASLGALRRQVVGPKGLTIGRAPGNDWVIPDPYVSKQHARIVCNDGRFFVEGLGRNPIALGRADNAIPTSERRPLDSGDRLFIDQYEILVTALPGEPPNGTATGAPVDPPVDFSLAANPTPMVPDPESETAELDPLHALGHDTSPERTELPPVNWQQSSPLGDHYKPPAPVQQGIPENWSHSVIVPRPAPQPRKQTTLPADLTVLLRAVGLPEGELSPEVTQELGKVLRVVVEGVMEMLQGRAEIKSQFRLPLTRIQARENNPLKLSPNVESALHTLLVQRNPGYLPTVQAFEDAFADIRNHQLAMLEGLRVAFESMLSAFDPRQMEQDFERMVKRTGLLGGLSGKSRYWELYAEHFSRLGRDADDTFRRLFGDVFAEAYERQLERLKKERP
jgi:type VI secretion system protein ImpI